MPRMRMTYNFSMVWWLSMFSFFGDLLNHRRVGLRREIKVIGAADVVVIHGGWPRRIANRRPPVELVPENRFHALAVVRARPQSTLGGGFHALGWIGFGQAQNPQAGPIAHLRMTLGRQDRLHQLAGARSGKLRIFDQPCRPATYILLTRLR